MQVLAILLAVTLGLGIPVSDMEQASKTKQFIQQPFAFDPDLKGLEANTRGRLKLKEEPIKNAYDTDRVDTLKHVSVKGADISYYYTKGNLLWYKATIDGKKVPLVNNVKLGMSRKALQAALPDLVKADDKLTATWDDVGTVAFTFKRDKLKSIYLERYIE